MKSGNQINSGECRKGVFAGWRQALALAGILALGIGAAVAAQAGKGTYLTTFPGTDAAGRNGYPAGTPQMSGKVAGKPAPTNEWYSNELISNHGDGIFNYPMALKPIDSGLAMILPIEYQAITAENPFIVGVEGVSTPQTTVSDFSDWTVTINWTGASGSMEAIIGQGMPMVYFSKSAGSGDAVIAINQGSFTIVKPNVAVATGCYNGASYAVFAPEGSTWRASGNTLRSDLAGKGYWTVAMLPKGADAASTAQRWSAYAFAVPSDTRAAWNYIPSNGEVTTTYSVTTDVKEGPADSKPLLGLLPHHWANLSGSDSGSDEGEFATVRGALKLRATTSFTTKRRFPGMAAVLPATLYAESGYDETRLKALVDEVCADTGFADWTDSYNDGQLLNRLSQTALVAREIGYKEGCDKAVTLLKNQLERWFTASTGDVAFVFYYHSPWNTLIAYPAGHGQDTNLNDHNFHFGYFIEAAATVALCDPAWAQEWGPMVDLLAADVANTDRNSEMFPYLRSFSPYSGHCWANGFATLGLGNDQESSSEAMMCHAALVKWAEVRGNRELRDAAVWMFTTELSAIQEYWFDVEGRNHSAGFQSALASRIFANGYDDENFWGGGIAGSYGIQIYPVQPSSAYLTENRPFASKLWDSMCSRTGILTGSTDPNIWYDSWAQYLAQINPGEGLGFYNANVSRMGGKFGVSHANTYYWVHSLAAAGSPDLSVTADSPLAQVYRNGDVKTYIAANYSGTQKTVKFSDGTTLTVDPCSTATYTDGEPEIATPVSPGGGSGGDGGGTGDNTDTPETAEVTQTDIEASEGTFAQEYTIGFTTLSGGRVKVSAAFGNESAYTGFDGPWLFHETYGFEEIRMEKAGSRYETVLSGFKQGDVVKVRVKIAFAGGLAVTRRLEYVVGTDKENGITGALDEPMISRVGDNLMVSTPEASTLAIYGTDGRRLEEFRVQGGETAFVSLEGYPKGVYIARIQPSSGKAPTIIKIAK